MRSSGFFTLVLTRRRTPYTFDELRALAPETLVPQAGGGFLLREHLLVAEGATLVIAPRRPLVIKLSSGPEGFVSVATLGGRLRLNGTRAAPITFQSWDESHGRADLDVTDGRAYVRASGQFVVRYTNFSQLGFWSGRTGGVSVVGSASLPGNDIDAGTEADGTSDDPVTTSGSSETEVLPAGKLPGSALTASGSFATRISDSVMSGNAFGLFIAGAAGPRISRTVINKSLVDGLVLHRDVESASVEGVKVDQSGSDGVVVSREVEGSVLTRMVVRRSGRNGIVLAGRPLADGPSASGSSTRAFGNNVLTASQSIDNAGIGVHVIGGTSVRVAGNTVTGGRAGIVISDGAVDIDVDSNRVAGVGGNGIQVRESSRIAVTANVVSDSRTGIHIRNSTGKLVQNSTSGVTLHAITFVGQVAGSTAEGNRLAGSGTSAIDTVRVVGPDRPTVVGNDLSGWSRTVTGDSLASVLLHPLTMIWMLVALILIVMSRPRRGDQQLPYATDPLGGRPDPEVRIPALDVVRAEREVPVRVTLPEPAPMPAPAFMPPPAPLSAPPPAQLPAPMPAPMPALARTPTRVPMPQPDAGRRDRLPTWSELFDTHEPRPGASGADLPPSHARTGAGGPRDVIDLAIHEALLAERPERAPRRRRVGSR